MMRKIPTAAQIEAEIKRLRLTIADVCREAGVAFTSFYRWRDGKASPNIDTVQRLLDALAWLEKNPPPTVKDLR